MANPWWAFYGRDYDAKTGHLTMLQHGAYFTLLNQYYISGGPLPEKTEHLVRICRAHSAEEIEAVSFVLSSFFFLRSDGWHNKRADAEIKEMKRISMLRRKARLGKRKTIDILNDNQLQRQSHTHTQKEEPKNKAASAFQIPDWLPKEEWLAFEEMRKKIRKPMTDKARSLIVTTLHKLRSHGHAPKLVLEQSIRNSWQDVYELRGELHEKERVNYGAGVGNTRPVGERRDRADGSGDTLGSNWVEKAWSEEPSEVPARTMGKAANGQ